jgi:hypothetical protein
MDHGCGYRVERRCDMLKILRNREGSYKPSITGVFWAAATKVGQFHLLTTTSNGQHFRISIDSITTCSDLKGYIDSLII